MKNPPRSQPLRELPALCLLVGFCVFWFSDTIADPDIWGHIRFGQDILRSRSIIQVDPYSYRTSGQSWFNHEWLSEVIFAGIYDRAGTRGLIALKVLVGLVIAGLCHAHLRRRGLGPFLSVALLMLMSIPFRMGLATIRPQLFTYLLFLIELLVLEGAVEGRRFGLWSLPILFAAWVNLHGGVLAGIGVLGLWIGVRAIEWFRGDPRPPVGLVPPVFLGVASSLALLINPHGPALIAFLLRTATVPRPEISEWTPLALTSLPGLIDLGLLAIGILGWIGSRRRREPSSLLIFGVTALLPMISNRHYPLFAMALVVLTGRHIADAAARFRVPGLSPRWHRGHSSIALVGGLILAAASPPRFSCIRVEPFYFTFPARAVGLLQKAAIRGNMAVPFDWGEYVIWHLGPAAKVSTDGRRETVYSEESYRQTLDLAQGTGVWDALLRTPPATDLVLAPNRSPTVGLMARAHDWLPLYQDQCCAIFVREGFPDIERLVRTPVPALPDDGRGLCFPDPSPTSRDIARP